MSFPQHPFAAGFLTALLLAGAAACPDPNAPCTSNNDCAAEEICVTGSCRKTCNADSDCGDLERCSDGICVASTDAGPGDAASVEGPAADHVRDATSGDTARPDLSGPDRDLNDTGGSDAGGPPQDGGAPADWSCPASYYGDSDCDCGCGVIDIDCTSSAAADCDYQWCGDGMAPALEESWRCIDAPPDAGSEDGSRDAATGDLVAADGPSGDSGTTVISSCSTVGSWQDNFSAPQLDPLWLTYEVGGGAVISSESVLGLSIPLSTSSTYAGAVTAYAARLIDEDLTVELTRPPAEDSGIEAGVYFEEEGSNRMGFWLQGGTLTPFVEGEGGDTSTSVTFDHSAHRFWRFREADGLVDLSTSSDGLRWTERTSFATPSWVAHGKINVWAGNPTRTSQAGQVEFDNLNTGRVATPWCPAANVTDDFSDGDIGAVWRLHDDGGCQFSESGGRLSISTISAGDALCELETAVPYTLEPNGDVSVIQLTVPGDSGAISYVNVWQPDVLYAAFGVTGGNLALWFQNNTPRILSPVGNYSQLRILRSRDALHFEARSAEALQWTEVAVERYTAAVGPVLLGLGLSCEACASSNITATFDDFNID